MLIGKVVGSVWAIQKESGMENLKFLMIRPLERTSDRTQLIIAADRIGAGVGERVLVSCGTPASLGLKDRSSPVDALVVGIVDSFELAEEEGTIL